MSQLREFITEKEHHRYRRDYPEYENLADEFKRLKLSPIERMTRRFELMLRLERPVLLPGEQICFLRTVKSLPDCFTKDEWESIRAKHHVHERGYISNLSPNYESAIKTGLLAKRENADEYGRRAIDAILALSDRYREEARYLPEFPGTAPKISGRRCSFSGYCISGCGWKATITIRWEDLINICILI